MLTVLNLFSGLGPALRRLREKRAGLTQVQVSERTGISQGRLSRYETGRKVPDLSTLDRLLTCYGMNLEDLSRALREAQGAPPSVAANDPELMASVRAVLAELGYSQPSPEPKT